MTGIGLDLDAGLAPGLDRWKGSTALRAARLQAGSTLLTGLSGRLGLDGDAQITRGALDLASAAARIGGITAARAAVDGRYGLSLANGGFTLLGNAGARGASARGAVAGAVAALGSAGGTPLEPVADSLRRRAVPGRRRPSTPTPTSASSTAAALAESASSG